MLGYHLKISKANLIVALVAFAIGCGVGILVFNYRNNGAVSYQLRLGQNGFINPLLACGANDNVASNEYNGLHSKLAGLINKEISDKKADSISIYFRDLDTAQWTGVNENELYIPASLLKVPLMTAYLKLAENNPSILNKKILFDQNTDDNVREHYRPPVSLQRGQYYSISELIDRMIIYSGNNSYNLLFAYINKEFLAKIYTDLDISVINEKEVRHLMSPKSYGTLWRVLYNASYLNHEISDNALKLLSRVTFDEGLRKGVPGEVLIAHKFGERSNSNSGTLISRQLHDCGIVYYPDHPYLLCVMTRGNDFDTLGYSIQGISKVTFDYVNKKYKQVNIDK